MLFADVVGSTALGEQLDPERLRSVLSSWFSVASAAVEAWGGTVEKFIGDAVVGAFGVPVIREDDAARALHAALDMLDRLPGLNERFSQQHDVRLAIRVGVNTGEVIAPRATKPGEPLVAGDAVNVAARLQQDAEPGTVLVGERTYLAARGAFEFGAPVELVVRGKVASTQARRLVGSRIETERGIPGLAASMVGRDRELGALVQALDETRAISRPRLVVVMGSAGIGKSRLIREFVSTSEAREEAVAILRGRCLAAGEKISYWALAEILRASAGISLDEPAESARDKLSRRVVETMAALPGGSMLAPSTFNALALTAGISVADSPLLELEPKAVADELSRAWPRFTTALSATGPVVLVIEDVHWASEELVEMLDRILTRSDGPVLIVATARPEFAQEHPQVVAPREDFLAVTLRPLSGDQSYRLLEELLAMADIPAGLRDEVVATVEGNPFFLEEVLRRLIDEGVLVRTGERWTATERAAGFVLPDSILGLLAARIDGLPPGEKRVLQEAAVIGRIFWEEPVRRLVRNEAVDEALGRLEGRGLIAARPISTVEGQTEYVFKHALVRDVAYAGLARRRRARAHAEVAAWIAELAGDRSEEFQDLLAHHYAEATLGDDADLAWEAGSPAAEQVGAAAYDALMVAGDAARRRYALPTAVERHQQARRLAPSDGDRARALEAVGDDEEAAYHGEEAWTALQEALAIARTADDRPSVARIALKLGRISTKIGTFRNPPDPEAVETLLAEGVAATDADDAVRARLLLQRGASTRDMWLLLRHSDDLPPEVRRGWIEEGVAIAAKLDDANLEWEALDALATWHWNQDDPAGALAWTEKSLDVLPRVDSASTRALGYYSASHFIRGLTGDYERALEIGRQSYELAQALSPHELMHGTLLLLLPLYRLGRWSEMEPYLAEHRAAWAEEAERTCGSVRGGLALGALLRVHQDRPVEARELLDLIGPPASFASIGDVLAMDAHVWLGEMDRAREGLQIPVRRFMTAGPLVRGVALDIHVAMGEWAALEEALPFAREDASWERILGPAADRAEGLLTAHRGDSTAARELLRRAISGYDDLRIPLEAALTKERLAALGEEPERSQLLVDALTTYRQLGANLHIRRLAVAQEGAVGA